MKKSQILAGEMESIRATLLELDAIEEPSEEQVEQARAELDKFTALEEQHRAAVEHEEKMERIRSMAISTPEVRESGSPDVQVRHRRDPFEDLDRVRGGFVSTDEVRARALTAIESLRSEYFTDDQRERASRLAANPAIARHILLTGSEEYRSEFDRWISDPMSYRGTALTLTDANGGYLVNMAS